VPKVSTTKVSTGPAATKKGGKEEDVGDDPIAKSL